MANEALTTNLTDIGLREAEILAIANIDPEIMDDFVLAIVIAQGKTWTDPDDFIQWLSDEYAEALAEDVEEEDDDTIDQDA